MDSFNPNTTIGVYQIGVLTSYVLFGVLTTQTYIYYTRFPDDSFKLKALVAFVWICEIAHTICVGHTLYVYTISDYGHPERLGGAVPNSLSTVVLLTGLIGISVQGFFSLRVYRFSRKLYISILIWALSLLRLVGSTVAFVTAMRMTSLANFETQWAWVITSVWSISVANDLTITTTLVVLLFNQRTNMHKRTVALTDKLITWTIETGMLTSVMGIIMLACFVTMKGNFIWLAVFINSPRLFSNSLLASLNSRATLRAMNEFSIPVSTAAFDLASNSMRMKVTHIANDVEPTRDQINKSTSQDV